MGFLLIGLLLLFFAINIPVAIAIGLSAVILCFISPDVDLIRLPQSMFSSLNSFSLLAIPFFVLAGKIMEIGGISQRLVNLASALVGHYKAGLAMVTILACTFFAALSGSCIATALAMGSIMIPSMVEKGYKRNFSAALTAAGGTIGPLIPPSIGLVLFGVLAGVSVGKLLIAGIIPGFLISISFMIVSYLMCRNDDNIVREPRMSFKKKLIALKDAIWALLMPMIILVGIYSGKFTPTEAAAVACLYGVVIGVFVYRQINFKILKDILFSSVLSTTAIMYILATASFFGTWLTLKNIPQSITSFFVNADLGFVLTLMIINLIVLIIGCFLDSTASLIIITPILFPALVALGMDPVQIGVIIVVNVGIGTLTPPMGINLFVASKVGKVPFESMLKPIAPFILASILNLAIIAIFPQITAGVANFLMK